MIHWKHSAKGQGLKLKEFEEERAQSYRIMLDLRCGESPSPELLEDFEKGVSVGCFAHYLLMRQGSVGLWTTQGRVPVGAGRVQIQRIMRALAAVLPQPHDAPAPPIESEAVNLSTIWIQYQEDAGGNGRKGGIIRPFATRVVDARKINLEGVNPEPEPNQHANSRPADEAVRAGASDLHLVSSSPPILRVDGALVPMDLPQISPQDIQTMIAGVLNDEQRQRFAREWELDFSISLRDVGRFRLTFIGSGAWLKERGRRRRRPSCLPGPSRRAYRVRRRRVCAPQPCLAGLRDAPPARAPALGRRHPLHGIAVARPRGLYRSHRAGARRDAGVFRLTHRSSAVTPVDGAADTSPLARNPGVLRIAGWNVARRAMFERTDHFTRPLSALEADILALDEVTGDRAEVQVVSIGSARAAAGRWRLAEVAARSAPSSPPATRSSRFRGCSESSIPRA